MIAVYVPLARRASFHGQAKSFRVLLAEHLPGVEAVGSRGAQLNNLVVELGTRYLLADGAMGTELYKRGLPIGGCAEAWNTDLPQEVLQVHRAYAEAGADCLTSNTFGANRYRLEERGTSPGRVSEINRAGVALAREAAGDSKWVLGSLGPCAGKTIKPGVLSTDDLYEAYFEQITTLAEARVDALLLETQTDLTETRAAAAAWQKAAPDVPLFITLSFMRLPHSSQMQLPRSGETAERAIDELVTLKLSGIGVNCGTDLDAQDYASLTAAVRARTDAPVVAQPNAGQSVACGQGFECTHTPEELAEGVWGLVRAGANLIGGCCGTSPAHIRLFRQELDQL